MVLVLIPVPAAGGSHTAHAPVVIDRSTPRGLIGSGEDGLELLHPSMSATSAHAYRIHTFA
jgi:hypothetical protein